MAEALAIEGSLVVPPALLEVRMARSSGPGGQNVNKVETKVELLFDAEAFAGLDEAARARLYAIPGVQRDKDGRVRVVSQLTRDRIRNLEDARAKLRALVRAALVRPRVRRPTRPGRGARERRLRDKREHSERKAGRRSGPKGE